MIPNLEQTLIEKNPRFAAGKAGEGFGVCAGNRDFRKSANERR